MTVWKLGFEIVKSKDVFIICGGTRYSEIVIGP